MVRFSNDEESRPVSVVPRVSASEQAMKGIRLIVLLGFLVGVPAVGSDRVRTTIPFDADWRFLKSDAPGAEKADFDDSTWRNLSVPHDWAIEGELDQNSASGAAGAFRDGGIGW